ncbi:MAG: type III ribulose-bisphosphate carboxylase [Candidatus Hodarchaeota archaeon]
MSKDKIEWYHEFIDLDYMPKETDLIALFYFEPTAGITTQDLIGRVASESSVGTWTTLETLDDRIYGMRALAYWQEKNLVKIAYPLELWEMKNVPQLLSGVAGNIFGMKAVRNLRLIDISIPEEYVKSFKGPNMGIGAIKQIFRKDQGPILSCVPKPKIGMTVDQHLKVAEDAWSGGIDCLKDDENLTDQNFNRFEKRVEGMARIRDRIEQEMGLVKDAYINVTAETHEMEKRVKFIHDHGFQYFMVDVVTVGFAAVQTLRNLASDLNMAIHAHRAMHATFTKHETHGISMYLLAKLLRLVGVDNLHIGTMGIGKLDSPTQDVLNMRDLLLQSEISEVPGRNLDQKWGHHKATMPIASGGLHPGVLPELLDHYTTTDIGIQVGGGVHGHPEGTYAGAKAFVQAIEGWKDGIALDEKAKSHPELAKALEKWGSLKPV